MDKFISDESSIIVRPCDNFHTCYEFLVELREHGIIYAVLRHCCHCTDCYAKRLIDKECANNVP